MPCTCSLYDVVRHYGCWLHRASHGRYTVIGRENIPTDGAIILAPNHGNGLQDAISVVDAVGQGVCFVARAQIFKNPILAACCRFFKMMPIGRMRDGMDAVRGNDKTFTEAVQVMKGGTPFCIFAEGTMRSKHSLLPLVKGIFRIALQANNELNSEAITSDSITSAKRITENVYILPMGIDYDDYFYFGDNATIEIGKPINVTEFVAKRPGMDQPHLINALQAKLAEQLKKLFRYLPDDADYPKNHRRFFGSRRLNHPALRWTAFVVGLPLFIVSAIICWPWAITELYIRFGITDHGFDRTFRYITAFLLGILTLGTIIPFWLYAIHYLNNARRLFGYQPGYQELMP